MTIHFYCVNPSCQKKYRAADPLAGRLTRCTSCQLTFRIPQVVTRIAVPAPLPHAPAEPPNRAVHSAPGPNRPGGSGRSVPEPNRPGGGIRPVAGPNRPGGVVLPPNEPDDPGHPDSFPRPRTRLWIGLGVAVLGLVAVVGLGAAAVWPARPLQPAPAPDGPHDTAANVPPTVEPSGRIRPKDSAPLPSSSAGSDPVVIEAHTGGVRALAVSADGKTVVTGGEDRTAGCWGPAGRTIWRSGRHRGPVRFVAASPDGRFVAAASAPTDDLRVWGVSTGTVLKEVPVRCGGLAFSADGRELYAESGGVVRVYATNTWAETRTFPSLVVVENAGVYSESVPDSMALAADGNSLFLGFRDGAVRRWDPAAGRRVQTFGAVAATRNPVFGLAPRPGGGVVTASADSVVRDWGAAGQLTASLKADQKLSAVAVCPATGAVGFGTEEGAVEVWRAGAADAQRLDGHTGRVTGLAYLPDGRLLSAGADGMVRIRPGGGSPAPSPAALASKAGGFGPVGEKLRDVSCLTVGGGATVTTLIARSEPAVVNSIIHIEHGLVITGPAPNSVWFIADGGAKWQGRGFEAGRFYAAGGDADLRPADDGRYSAWGRFKGAVSAYRTKEAQGVSARRIAAGETVRVLAPAPEVMGWYHVRWGAAEADAGWVQGEFETIDVWKIASPSEKLGVAETAPVSAPSPNIFPLRMTRHQVFRVPQNPTVPASADPSPNTDRPAKADPGPKKDAKPGGPVVLGALKVEKTTADPPAVTFTLTVDLNGAELLETWASVDVPDSAKVLGVFTGAIHRGLLSFSDRRTGTNVDFANPAPDLKAQRVVLRPSAADPTRYTGEVTFPKVKTRAETTTFGVMVAARRGDQVVNSNGLEVRVNLKTGEVVGGGK